MSDTAVSKQAAPLISRHMKDLLRRPIEAVKASLEDPNSPGDVRQRKHSKGLAARAVAARYIIKAIEGSASHGDTLLDRTEGKVASQDAQGGAVINFNFNITNGEQGVRQVGEVIQGVLATAQAAPHSPSPTFVVGQLAEGVNPMTCQPIDTSTPASTSHAQTIDDAEDKQ